jgi:hypothetical protein
MWTIQCGVEGSLRKAQRRACACWCCFLRIAPGGVVWRFSGAMSAPAVRPQNRFCAIDMRWIGGPTEQVPWALERLLALFIIALFAVTSARNQEKCGTCEGERCGLGDHRYRRGFEHDLGVEDTTGAINEVVVLRWIEGSGGKIECAEGCCRHRNVGEKIAGVGALGWNFPLCVSAEADAWGGKVEISNRVLAAFQMIELSLGNDVCHREGSRKGKADGSGEQAARDGLVAGGRGVAVNPDSEIEFLADDDGTGSELSGPNNNCGMGGSRVEDE